MAVRINVSKLFFLTLGANLFPSRRHEVREGLLPYLPHGESDDDWGQPTPTHTQIPTLSCDWMKTLKSHSGLKVSAFKWPWGCLWRIFSPFRSCFFCDFCVCSFIAIKAQRPLSCLLPQFFHIAWSVSSLAGTRPAHIIAHQKLPHSSLPLRPVFNVLPSLNCCHRFTFISSYWPHSSSMMSRLLLFVSANGPCPLLSSPLLRGVWSYISCLLSSDSFFLKQVIFCYDKHFN